MPRSSAANRTKAAMKRLVVLSDGTGNSSAKAQKTNVWRMFQALDQTGFDQLAKYDDGVGTSSNKYLAALGGVFGFGLKRNVVDLYKFICRNYEKDDEIFAFGFSRGAFTIRVLVGLIATQGLVGSRSEQELHANALKAYRAYRIERFPSRSPFVWLARKLRELVLGPWTKEARKHGVPKRFRREQVPIKFMGLWDTVAAYGLPIDELKWGFNLLVWPMVAADRYVTPCVERACHALALDEQRETFAPILFDETMEPQWVNEKKVRPGRLTQVWFAGVHSNIGGGYPEDGASLVSLDWMMSQAVDAGLRLLAAAMPEVANTESAYARLYDSRAGVFSYYRYSPRRIDRDSDRHPMRPIVHGSVVMRMAHGSDLYAPISLPETFDVLAPDGSLIPMQGFGRDVAPRPNRSIATTAVARVNDRLAALQAAIVSIARPDAELVRQVEDTIWWRRVTYFACLFFTFCLLAFPFAADRYAAWVHAAIRHIPLIGADLDALTNDGFATFDAVARPGAATVAKTIAPTVPQYLEAWLDAAVRLPLEMLIAVILVAIPFAAGSFLAMRIHDRAWFAWHPQRRFDYLKWLRQSAHNASVRALVLVVLFGLLYGASFVLSWSDPVKALVVAGLAVSAAVLLWRLGIARRLRHVQADIEEGRRVLPSTPTLKVARFLRSSDRLTHAWWLLSERIIPVVVVLLFVVGVLASGYHFVYLAQSSAGKFCVASPPPADTGAIAEEKRERHQDGFETSQVCWASTITVTKGLTYEVELESNGDWFDQVIRTDVAGFATDGLKHILAWPLKRSWSANWFQPILRVGTVGNDEYLLEVKPPREPVKYEKYDGPPVPAFSPIDPAVARRILEEHPKPQAPRIAKVRFTATQDGELFVYVNDALSVVPREKIGVFYGNNSGTGRLKVRRMSSGG
jgi:uncharacterized protein (DUF2235 family)